MNLIEPTVGDIAYLCQRMRADEQDQFCALNNLAEYDANAAARQLVASQCGEPGWPQLLAAHDAARQEIANWWASIRPDQQEKQP